MTLCQNAARLPVARTEEHSVTATVAAVPDTPDGTVPLSTLFRDGTRDEHRAAESAGFIEALMAGRLSHAAYADLAAQLRVVYDSIESVGAELGATVVGATVVFPARARPLARR